MTYRPTSDCNKNRRFGYASAETVNSGNTTLCPLQERQATISLCWRLQGIWQCRNRTFLVARKLGK